MENKRACGIDSKSPFWQLTSGHYLLFCLLKNTQPFSDSFHKLTTFIGELNAASGTV
jgi:hypothetical protein